MRASTSARRGAEPARVVRSTLDGAVTLYERIAESLTSLTPSGQWVTITLDGQSYRLEFLPAANPALEHHDEPKNTDTPSESPDKNPDEKAGPAAA
ncbi:hypothetical protein [Streptomyces sp. NPDC002602]|uniref:hypothetical protein n=1 Tax=Streptomyces sp. NPDC002602 TaxID=3364654 RepID=UPI0036A952EE